jgi:hypothetical protein
MPSHAKHLAILLIAVSCLPAFAQQASRPTRLSVDWTKTLRISVSTPTIQVVVNPKLRPGEVVRTEAYKAFRNLDPEYARFVPWFPYPRMAVAELSAPTATGTSWDFGLIDPLTVDFLEATKGRNGYINFSTIPAWMFKTPKPVSVPADPNKPDWDYNQGTELVDPTGKQLGDYYGRIASWYSQGGFTDERGIFRKSAHHYALPLYEVLNEVEAEHLTTPKQYAERYDAIVSGIRAVSPKTQFIALALADPRGRPEFFEYFLNKANHRPGIPLDWISYHFYAVPEAGETIDDWQYTFFSQADGFLDNVKYVETIRKRLSPRTRTMINETGSILHSDLSQVAGVPNTNIPHAYWNLAGAVYAYVYEELTKLGIDVVGESQLVGYPTQFPSVTMVDWNTGKPNARFQVLKLLRDNMGPGDRIIDTGPHVMTYVDSPIVETAYVRNGMRKVLLINRRAGSASVDLPGAADGAVQIVDQASAGGPIRREKLGSSTITLGGFSVAIIDLPEIKP